MGSEKHQRAKGCHLRVNPNRRFNLWSECCSQEELIKRYQLPFKVKRQLPGRPPLQQPAEHAKGRGPTAAEILERIKTRSQCSERSPQNREPQFEKFAVWGLPNSEPAAEPKSEFAAQAEPSASEQHQVEEPERLPQSAGSQAQSGETPLESSAHPAECTEHEPAASDLNGSASESDHCPFDASPQDREGSRLGIGKIPNHGGVDLPRAKADERFLPQDKSTLASRNEAQPSTTDNLPGGLQTNRTATTSQLLRSVLKFAERRWYVFPCWWIENGHCACGNCGCELCNSRRREAEQEESDCSPGKHPIGDCSPGKHPIGELAKRGVLDASIYTETIKRWWARYPLANLALACGRSKLIHADIDPRHGGDEQGFWEKVGCQIETVRTLTPSGGIHLWFAAPAGDFTVSVGKFLPGVDIRAGNGYVMLPPSDHILGVYEFETGHNPREIQIADCPIILAEFARRRDAFGEARGNLPEQSEATGFDLLRALSGLPEGERDDQLFRAACSFRGSNTSKAVALQAVAEAAVKCVPPFSVQRAMEKVYRAYNRYPAGTGQIPEAALSQKAAGMILASEYLQHHAKRASRHAWWKGILYAGAFNMLVGRPFTGKSSFAAALTRALMREETFLGRDCAKAKVGYFALERNGATVAKLFDKWDIANEVYFADEIPAQNAAAFIEQEIKRLSLDFVVIDHLQHATRIQKGNEYAEVSNALMPFQEIAERTGCCILALHHQGKGERENRDDSVIDVLGTEAYRAASDTLIEATKVKGEFFIRAHTRTATDLARTHIVIDFESGEVEGTNTHEADVDATIAAVRDFLLARTEPQMEKEIRKGIGGQTKKVNDALRTGLQREIFGRLGEGGKKDPYRYFCISGGTSNGAANNAFSERTPISSQEMNQKPTSESLKNPADVKFLHFPSFREMNTKNSSDPAGEDIRFPRFSNTEKSKSVGGTAAFRRSDGSSPVCRSGPSPEPQEREETQKPGAKCRLPSQLCPYDGTDCPVSVDCDVDSHDIGCRRLRTLSSGSQHERGMTRLREAEIERLAAADADDYPERIVQPKKKEERSPEDEEE